MTLRRICSSGHGPQETFVLYPGFLETCHAVVVAAFSDDAATYIVTDQTPFHPLDPFWPDQPGEQGVVELQGSQFVITDTLTGAWRSDAEEWIYGTQINFKRSTPGWTYFVVHRVEGPGWGQLTELLGAPVTLGVDTHARRRIAAAHTANHLTAFAVNRAAKPFAADSVRKDSLGNPNVDALALVESRIDMRGTTDRYRFGKSLRKAGFAVDQLFGHLGEFSCSVNDSIAGWLKCEGAVTVTPPASRLSERREWRCSLEGLDATMPCGGVHVDSLQNIAASNVTITLDDAASLLEVRTETSARKAES